ncbi:hypothetical protein B0F90DRAFT_819582 [Multifurca ochricompacta]|uniref:Uncharacterized protein n=1 Tax=Multifurca ochricompacta TaxID=376703 RepID=A0AAD4MBG2_9AGAM|nr:hypothetical protein B0F90DRAFT_819582 [Multifurca ochricompacta]
MTRLAYYPTPSTRRLGNFTLDTAKRWSTSLGFWGFGVSTALLFLLSVTPKVKNTLLLKMPVLSNYYEDKTPTSDKPF